MAILFHVFDAGKTFSIDAFHHLLSPLPQVSLVMTQSHILSNPTYNDYNPPHFHWNYRNRNFRNGTVNWAFVLASFHICTLSMDVISAYEKPPSTRQGLSTARGLSSDWLWFSLLKRSEFFSAFWTKLSTGAVKALTILRGKCADQGSAEPWKSWDYYFWSIVHWR